MLGAIRKLLGRVGQLSPLEMASTTLARDLGLPTDDVSRILGRTDAALRRLSLLDSDDVDARPIIDRAVSELSNLGIQSRPFEEAAMEQYLCELPDLDYQILMEFKAGKSRCHIAEIVNTDVETVRTSLVRTYANLRIRIIQSSDAIVEEETKA